MVIVTQIIITTLSTTLIEKSTEKKLITGMFIRKCIKIRMSYTKSTTTRQKYYIILIFLVDSSVIFTVKKLCHSSHFIILCFILRYQNCVLEYVFVWGWRKPVRTQYAPKIPSSPSLQKSRVREFAHRSLKGICLSSLTI